MTNHTTLGQFLAESYLRQQWVTFNMINLYIRRSRHLIDGSVRDTFDFANMSAPEAFRSSGSLWQAIELAESSHERRVVFIENVHSERLAESLRRRGWCSTSSGGFSQSYYRSNSVIASGNIAEESKPLV